MIQYPTKRKPMKESAISTKNRGMSLEFDLNSTNEYYRVHQLANVHKKPTPIQVVSVSYPSRNQAKIVEAYYKTPSTTDYNGVTQGIYFDFEAKEVTDMNRFALPRIHDHQIKHLKDIMFHQGCAFLIIRFVKHDLTFFVPFEKFYKEYTTTKLRSIPLSWFQSECDIIQHGFTPPLNYLPHVHKWIKEKYVK
jgi:recombination protein U